ncbi:hypothetical protein HU200_056107 [Digitaria exilis]|uniref:KIB1-4 beta-propeller domain-containing protein n=1 Tax=Digitaria exilis TaxID=1010633 RepID=A0A835AHN8_9POAL|nr:hypothetical protein HU200_056107 [Digitaria exilis]
MLSVTAAGDEGWRLLKNPYDSIEYTNTTVFNGKVLAVTKFEGIYSWDMEGGAAAEPTLLQGPEELFTDDPNFKREFYLFALSDGGELQVVCMYDYIVKNSHTFGILLKRVSLHELDASSSKWRRVMDLDDDRALFVGGNHPFYVVVPQGGAKDLQADYVYVMGLNACDAAQRYDTRDQPGVALNASVAKTDDAKARIAYSLLTRSFHSYLEMEAADSHHETTEQLAERPRGPPRSPCSGDSGVRSSGAAEWEVVSPGARCGAATALASAQLRSGQHLGGLKPRFPEGVGTKPVLPLEKFHLN